MDAAVERIAVDPRDDERVVAPGDRGLARVAGQLGGEHLGIEPMDGPACPPPKTPDGEAAVQALRDGVKALAMGLWGG